MTDSDYHTAKVRMTLPLQAVKEIFFMFHAPQNPWSTNTHTPVLTAVTSSSVFSILQQLFAL